MTGKAGVTRVPRNRAPLPFLYMCWDARSGRRSVLYSEAGVSILWLLSLPTQRNAHVDTSTHNLTTLFAQLGLPNEDQDIDRFIDAHRELRSTEALDEASFWNAAQAAFLREAIQEDSDWAEVVDQLDARLRS